MVVSVEKEDLEVAVDIGAVGEHLAVHLVALPRLLLVPVVDAVVRAETHCKHTKHQLRDPMREEPHDHWRQ